jgi:hypothetical protein
LPRGMYPDIVGFSRISHLPYNSVLFDVGLADMTVRIGNGHDDVGRERFKRFSGVWSSFL